MEADHQLRCDLYANGSNTGEVRGQLIETVEAMNMAVLPSACLPRTCRAGAQTAQLAVPAKTSHHNKPNPQALEATTNVRSQRVQQDSIELRRQLLELCSSLSVTIQNSRIQGHAIITACTT